MAESINLILDEDGVARIYDDTYDITIHCESQEEQDKVLLRLDSTEWLGDYAPFKCERCGFHVDSKTKYCPMCGRKATNYD